MSLTHAQITERLEQIEADLAERQPDYESAAEDVHRASRDMELRLARGKATSQATTETAKKEEALLAISTAADNLYCEHVEALARYEGLRAAVKVLEQRAMIGMALLKASTREAPQTGAQPTWSAQ